MQKLITQVQSQLKTSSVPFRPIIITDIDGVLLRGKTPIPGTLNAIRKIHQNSIPFACLTNGGGNLQANKAKSMNQIFGEQLIQSQFMFMNHTPLRPLLSQFSQKKGILLVAGIGEIKQVLAEMNISNYVTADELFTIFHQNDSLSNKNVHQFYERPLKTDQVMKMISTRFNGLPLPTTYTDWENQINSIFAINDVSPYETLLEVIHHVFAQKKIKNVPLPPYFAAQNDTVWASGYPRPRFAFGPFNQLLKTHCQHHHFDLSITYFGKPERKAFEYVQHQMVKHHGDGIFFMVGDNPKADIRGANSIGWISFLTKTGLHKTDQNDSEDPATMVVDNFESAIEQIFKLKDFFAKNHPVDAQN